MPGRRHAGWSSPRIIVTFAVALCAVSAAAFGLSRLYATRPPLDLTPARDYVAAPAPSAARGTGAGEGGASAAAPHRPGQKVVSAAWLTTTAAKAGIPIPALRAYADAQLDQPGGCSIGWTTLAGIGWVESHHGTIDGRTLGDDGRSSRPIIGPALDGGDFAAIRSTPTSQAWHGDATWEHAVGPMQFINSSWQRWATDGDGDGVADPNDIDDAAFTTARYLCASGQNLATGPGWAAAVFSFNHSQAYVDQVYDAASTYAARTR